MFWCFWILLFRYHNRDKIIWNGNQIEKENTTINYNKPNDIFYIIKQP